MKKKALLIIPEMYSIKNVVSEGLEGLGYNVIHIDYRKKINNRNRYLRKLHTILSTAQNRFAKLQGDVNEYYKKTYNNLNPDLVIIYNDELILPNTLYYFKQKSNVIFLLGDNPLTLNPPNIYNIQILFQADIVVCADSSWKKQLERIGLNNIIYDYLAYSSNVFSSDVNTPPNKRDNDILFVGRTYAGSWGFKRCLFLDQFTDLNIDIYGSGAHWLKWLDYFPKIGKKLIYNKSKLSFEKFKQLLNSYKVFPVDANPGLINGIHLRVFECISAGILPLIEYTKNIDLVFNGVPLPVIHNFGNIKELTSEYLNNDEKRIKILTNAKEYLDENYSPRVVIKRILDKIK